MKNLTSNSASYKFRPIGSIRALASALGFPETYLLSLSKKASRLYRVAKRIKKPDGSERITFDAWPTLKRVQARILTRVLNQVVYPNYLHGSVKGRDYKSNAVVHAGSRLLITEDVRSFFPSVSEGMVLDVWRHLFHFSDPVSKLLTALTTREGCLPQGAKTSSHLANLVLWRVEPDLNTHLSRIGFRYSRYVDDMSASTMRRANKVQQTKAIAVIYGSLHRAGLSPKRNKHEIQTGKGQMVVTKLLINQKPAVSKKERARIRAAVRQCESLRNLEFHRVDMEKLLASTTGRVGMLKRFHPVEAKGLEERLKKARAG